MFYVTTHSTHFIYGYMASEKKGQKKTKKKDEEKTKQTIITLQPDLPIGIVGHWPRAHGYLGAHRN